VSPYPCLEKLKIGCVKYLNAKPLIFGYEGEVCFDHPSHLATMLAEGRLDIALVPIFELMRNPHYPVVDGVSISAAGPVYSVFLAYRGELSDIKTVSLDVSSLTSVHLIRCILGEYHGLTPEYISSDTCKDKTAAQLLIGNQAIDFRRAYGKEYKYLDLGEEWLKQTGLPFVFAAWLIRPGVPDATSAADELRALKQHGVASIPEIVPTETVYDAAFVTKYLSEYIHFNLGDGEKKGITKFRELLLKHGHIVNDKPDFIFT